MSHDHNESSWLLNSLIWGACVGIMGYWGYLLYQIINKLAQAIGQGFTLPLP